jgi:iron complex outermembrane receptor protein
MDDTTTGRIAGTASQRGGTERTRLVLSTAIATALLAAGPARASDAGTAPIPQATEQTSRAEVFPTPAIVVSAARIVDAPPTLVVREVSVADLEAYNAHTVGEGLIPVSGVNVQNGGTSGDLRAWIRGYRDRDTLVLFDGIPIASGFEGTIDLNEIATEQVGSIKVLKSAPSVIYGTNGMGGVIDILPRTGTDASLFSANLEGGSDDRRVIRGSSGAGNGNLSYLLSASHDSADNYSLSDDYPGDLNQPRGERINSDFERNSVFLSLDAKETAAGHLSMFYNLSDAEKGLPPTAGVEEPDFERLDKSTRQTIGLSDQLTSIPLAIKAYYNQYESELTVFTDGTYHEIDDVEKAKDYSYGLKLYSTLRAGEHNSVVLHASGQTDVYIAQGDLEDGNRAEITTWTAAIEDQYVVTDTLSLAVGGIFNLFEQTLLNRSSSAFNPQAAVSWQATDRLALHASAAQRTRFPKLRELYRRRYGNPDLDPQTAENYELGLTFDHSARYHSDVAWFHSDVHDLIERPDRRSHYENLAPVTIDGIEFSTSGRLTDKLYTRLSYMHVKAEETLPGGGSRQLRSRPEDTVQFELRYLFPLQFEASVNGVYVDGLHDLDDDDVYLSLDSYFVANMKVAKTFNDHVSAYLAVANLLDENYQQRLGDPREGRSVRLGVNWQL